MKCILFTLALCLASGIAAHAEATTTPPNPKEYSQDEFPSALNKTFRFIIIAGGAFPVGFAVSELVISQAYPSWSIKKQIGYSSIYAGSFAVTIAITDLVIGLIQERNAANNKEPSFD